jgi:hypothetical protein
MNERIKELAKCNERISNFFETGPVQRAAIEQFAELIVWECAGLMYGRDENGNCKDGDVILKHFGVE